MNRNNTYIIIPLLLFALVLPCSFLLAGNDERPRAKAGEGVAAGREPGFTAMTGPNRKVLIGNDAYLIYGFDRSPKMGTLIMKIQAYDSRGEKDTSLTITADSGMPSMAGMHSGHHTFQLSRKGDYLAPMDITMPGDWEIKVTVMKEGKVLFRGSHKFDV
jgi:hypothetical protein